MFIFTAASSTCSDLLFLLLEVCILACPYCHVEELLQYCLIHLSYNDLLLGLSLICSKFTYYSFLNFPKFLFYSQAPPFIPFLFYCVNDNIAMQDWLYIIYIVTDCFNRIFDCSIRVSRFFANQVARHSKHLGGAGPCQACLFATTLFETNLVMRRNPTNFDPCT